MNYPSDFEGLDFDPMGLQVFKQNIWAMFKNPDDIPWNTGLVV